MVSKGFVVATTIVFISVSIRVRNKHMCFSIHLLRDLIETLIKTMVLATMSTLENLRNAVICCNLL